MNWNDLAFAATKVTTAAAIASAYWIGRGDGKAADAAAVDAMRAALQQLPIDGRIVIGEGERDEAPMLYIGEKLGIGGIEIDIAVDPLEGTNLCANSAANSITVLAMAKRGDLLHAPDVYMNKIAVGAGIAPDAINLNAPIAYNIEAVAAARGKAIADILVVILDRPRHAKLITDVYACGAKVQLIGDGDVCAIIEAADPNSPVDMVAGIGGAPEGVLAAAALRCMGGSIQAQLLFENDEQRIRASKMGITDYDKVYEAHELARGDVIFAATGVTNGYLLKGIAKCANGISAHSICMESRNKITHYIETIQKY